MTSQITENPIEKKIPSKHTFRQFLFIWSGQILSLLGSVIVQFIMIWWITTETQNSIYLSLAAFLGFIPQVILSPFMGVLADKFDRQKIIIISDFLQASVTLILILGLRFNFLNYTLFFSILLLRSAFQSIQSPSSQAIVSLMVPKEKLSRFNGVDYMLSSIVAIIGPALAALLLKFFTFYQILYVDLITFVFALIPLIIFKIPKLTQSSTTPEKKGIREYFSKIKGGITLLRSNRPFMTLLFTATAINLLLMPFNTLLPFYVNVTNQGTEDQLAVLMGALKVGLLIGAIITTLKKEWKYKMRSTYIFLSLQYIGCMMLSFSALQSYYIMSSGLVLAGLTFPIVNTIITTAMQQKIPAEYQGRIFSLMMSISGLISPIGIILSGPLANLIGVRLLWIISSILAFVLIQLIWGTTNISKAMITEFAIKEIIDPPLSYK